MLELKTDYNCIKCLINRYSCTDTPVLSDEEKTLYIKELLKIIAEVPISISSPEIVEKITALQRKYGISTLDYAAIKKQYNSLLLSFEQEIWEKINSSEDKLYCAMSYAFTGNYIDFGALSDITQEKLRDMIDKTQDVIFDKKEYNCLKQELACAKRLVYLTDNCGEIVFDKLLIRLLKQEYPSLEIKAVVRGLDVLNDATMQDALEVGLDKVVEVTHNGTGIAGTVLNRINRESLSLIEQADVIISKGMGNFETLTGSSLNIYYMFLCKCEKFCRLFNKPKFSYMLLNEKRI